MMSHAGLSLVLTMSGLFTTAADSGVLKWKFKEGDVFYQQADTDIKQTMTLMGMQMKQTITQATITKFTVKKVNRDGGIVLEQTIVDARGKGDVGNTTEKLKGVTFTVTLDKDYHITKFEGYEKFLDKASDGDKEARKMLAAVLSEDVFKQSINESFTVLPGKSVAVGDKWERKMKVSMGPIGDLATESTYKYEGKAKVANKEVDKITYTATMKYAPPGNAIGGLPFKITKGDLKAKDFKGTLFFDADSGRVVETTQSMNLSGGMTFDIQGMSIDVEMEQDQTVKSRVSTKELKFDD